MDERHRAETTPLTSPPDVDSAGSPVGVARLDPVRSYVGVGALLQAYVDGADDGAWAAIRAKIDYTYDCLDLALAPLDAETGFGHEIQARAARGQKLLFKPNLVVPLCISPQTHGPDVGSVACTEWPFVAALMRWCHDRLGISYYQMSVGDAATALTQIAASCTMANRGKPVTTEAIVEGRSGDFYGGWGFYFVRRYLADRLASGDSEDPMRGYDESVAGTYLPPGRVTDRLMVYDLNRIDEESKGREIPVPGGVNFHSITLHKAIVGGDPDDPRDREAYPGCVLVNVPKLKVHAIALLTSAVKNLGIGLYPMESTRGGARQWQYGVPRGAAPGMKGGLPHQIWVADVDPDSGLPRKDASGSVVVSRTGGLSATMADVVRAVMSQDIFSLHVVDGIEAINHDHTGGGDRVPEGLVFAGLDPVATDLACARYLFGNTPLAEAEQTGLDDGAGGRVAQRVPVPCLEDGSIVTRPGYDCPLARDRALSHAEERGIGRRVYHVVGRDAVAGQPMVSLRGHLGHSVDGQFSDVVTSALYFAVQKTPWDLQKTCLGYFEAVDHLTGSDVKRRFLAAMDEDGDGVVTYEEFGKNGNWTAALHLGGIAGAMRASDAFGAIRGSFVSSALMSRYARADWNPDSLGVFEEVYLGTACLVALRMSQAAAESPDPFHPGLASGMGKWPSFELASYVQLAGQIYGSEFPTKLGVGGLYGLALAYADATQNQGRYLGSGAGRPDLEGVSRYLADLASGRAKPLDFTLAVPLGYGTVAGQKVPNVVETADPYRLFTASFRGGAEVWPSAKPGADVRRAAEVLATSPRA